MLCELINNGLLWHGDSKKQDPMVFKKPGVHEFISDLPPLSVFSDLTREFKDSYVFWVGICPMPQFLISTCGEIQNHLFVYPSDLKKVLKSPACIITTTLPEKSLLHREATIFLHSKTPTFSRSITRWRVSPNRLSGFTLTPLKGFYVPVSILSKDEYREAA